MKLNLPIIVLIPLLASCVKGVNSIPVVQNKPVLIKPAAIQRDTVPDGGTFKIAIQKDSLHGEETLVVFNHKSSAMYINTQDAVYFPGFGFGGISTLSSDGVACAIQELPYLQGSPIGLKINAMNDGIYILRLNYVDGIPHSIRFWLKDKYMKDSLDMRVGNYAFQVIKADTDTYGGHRFIMVLR